MTENQALFLKDVLFRVKQFYYGVSDKPLSAAQMTAGEATEYVAALKEAEQSLCLPDRGRVLPPDADTMLLQLCKLTREALLDTIWAYEYRSDIRTVDVHIRRLREKLEENPAQPQYIMTKWGVGYYFRKT